MYIVKIFIMFYYNDVIVGIPFFDNQGSIRTPFYNIKKYRDGGITLP